MLWSMNYTSIKHTNKTNKKPPTKYRTVMKIVIPHERTIYDLQETFALPHHTDDRYLKISITYFY